MSEEERENVREEERGRKREKEEGGFSPCRAPRGLADPRATATHTSTGNHIWDETILVSKYRTLSAETVEFEVQRNQSTTERDAVNLTEFKSSK